MMNSSDEDNDLMLLLARGAPRSSREIEPSEVLSRVRRRRFGRRAAALSIVVLAVAAGLEITDHAKHARHVNTVTVPAMPEPTHFTLAITKIVVQPGEIVRATIVDAKSPYNTVEPAVLIETPADNRWIPAYYAGLTNGTPSPSSDSRYAPNIVHTEQSLLLRPLNFRIPLHLTHGTYRVAELALGQGTSVKEAIAEITVG